MNIQTRLSKIEKTVHGQNRCKARRVFIIADIATPDELEAHDAAVAQAEKAGHDVKVIRLVSQ
jgi:hypothetical protein